MTELERTIEAILFVSEDVVTTAELAEVTEKPRTEITEAISALQEHYAMGHALEIHEIAGGWRMYTAPDLHPYLERFAATDKARRLSSAAIETLAVIAYKQPVSRGQVTEIRGVDSERAIRTLERRDLVVEVGRAPGPGQAVLYGTTELFLEKMGLASVADLPPLADHVPPAQIMETLEMPMRAEPSSNDSTN